MKEARLLKQENEESGWMWWSAAKLVGLSVFGPMLAMLPFVSKITDDCTDSLVGHSIWCGCKLFVSVCVCVLAPSTTYIPYFTQSFSLVVLYYQVRSITTSIFQYLLDGIHFDFMCFVLL